MRSQFFDRQHTDNPLNGVMVDNSAALRTLVHNLQGREPFFAELIGDNRCKLLLGIGPAEGCVQFSTVDGAPPYLMAMRNDPEQEGVEQNCLDFLIGDTPTPVPRRYCLPMHKVVEIAANFLMQGERSTDVTWESI
jgi:hypothetical protein